MLDALRQPLEEGKVRLARSQGNTTYPTKIQLVLAANPCPCGASQAEHGCECGSLAKRRYLGRISGPLLDRVDLRVTLEPLRSAALAIHQDGAEDSATVAGRVAEARDAAAARWSTYDWCTNSEVKGAVLRRKPWRLPASTTAGLATRLDRGQISARGYDRLLRCAWTIADLAGSASPTADHIEEAVQLRLGSAA